jgi:hypothetical protein
VGENPDEARKSRSGNKPSSSDTAASISAASKASTSKETKSLKSAGKQKARLIEQPTLNAMRSMRSAKKCAYIRPIRAMRVSDEIYYSHYSAPKSGFVESEEEEEEEQAEAVSNGGKSKSKQALKKKAATSDTETEKTQSDSDTAIRGKRTK